MHVLVNEAKAIYEQSASLSQQCATWDGAASGGVLSLQIWRAGDDAGVMFVRLTIELRGIPLTAEF